MGYIIGGFDGLLPYGKEMDRCGTEGGMFQAAKYCNAKYAASLNKVLAALERTDPAEDEEPEEEYCAEENCGGDESREDADWHGEADSDE